MQGGDLGQCGLAPGDALRVDTIRSRTWLVEVGRGAARFQVRHELPSALAREQLQRRPPVVRMTVAEEDEDVDSVHIAVDTGPRVDNAVGDLAAIGVRVGKLLDV